MENNDFNYGKIYKLWHSDETLAKDIIFIRQLLESHAAFPKNKDAKIIDVGCGTGITLMALLEMGYVNQFGIDIDKSQIETAKSKGLNVEHIDALDYFKLGKEKYDAIYLLDILEHFRKEDIIPLLRLLENSLSENGFIFIQTPNAMCPTATFFRYGCFTHTLSFTDKTLVFVLENAGFENYTIRPQSQEPKSVQVLKLPWARMYRHEYLINDFILTPNLISLVFKNNHTLNVYLEDAPKILNEYLEDAPKILNEYAEKTSRYKRWWQQVKKMKF